MSDDTQWYRDAVIYELHVRSFADSDGDGIGDFRGLTGRLDYLQDLGVTAIWMLPFYPSPLRDDGYDIADYQAVNPMYGTLRDFKRFVKEAHARDIQVITELVINHTSDQHPWFRRAVRAAPGSRYRDWYVWSDDPTRYGETRIIFQDFEQSNWTWHPEAGQYYWHRFYSHQPDLNFDNPEVREAVTKALDHWMAMGVDGMRLDAIPYLFERDGTNNENLPETHAYLKDLRGHLDRNWPNRMFLAEANQWPEDAAAYFGDGDECHMNFHFPLMPRLYMAVAMEDRFPIIDILQQTPELPDNAQWALFLRNHDELTLEMVTDEERDYMRRVYAHDPNMRINLGIRRRLAPLLNNDRRLIELMNALLFSLPGTPVLYYGDEIGMGDNHYLGDRDGVRTPMQWNGDRNAGFSTANPQQLFLPVIIDPEYHYETVNVEAQRNNPRSLWWWMKRTIGLRKRYELFGRGTIEFLHPDNPKVLAFRREYGDQQVLVVANLSRHAQACELDLSAAAGLRPVEMFGSTPFPAVTEQPYPVTLGPYGYYWFLLEPSSERLSVKYPGATLPDQPDHPEDLPRIATSVSWPRLGQTGGALTRSLPDILKRQRWFGGKARTIRRTSLVDTVRLTGAHGEVSLALIELEYADGDPEQYVVPLAFAAGEAAEHVRQDLPAAILAEVEGRGDATDGVLYDALWDAPAIRNLVDAVRRGRSVSGRVGTLEVWKARGEKIARPADDVDLRPIAAEQSNTSIVVGTDHILKIVRRPDEGTNPDLEVGRFLTERARFPHTPAVVGAVEYRAGRRPARTVAILQRYVPNEGDAWRQALGSVDHWVEERLTRTDPLPPAGAPQSVLARAQVPDEVTQAIGSYTDHVRLLGQRTAELHAALASDLEDPDFAPEPFTSLYQRSVYQHMRTRSKRTLARVRRRLSTLDDEVAAQAQELADREDELLARFDHLKTDKLTGSRTRT
ncbi:MAG TPA: maltose alpha-D-glucosyltransferase, partial [Acidimicrobiia bacterium]|nr:maltose alpha-D-glucosyltransferase [Acidimicrobiia bacterium]